MRRPRLFWRIYAAYLVVIVASIVAVGLFAYEATRDFYLDTTATELQARASLAREEVGRLLAENDRPRLQETVKRLAAASGTRFTVISGGLPEAPLGTVIAESETAPDNLANHRDRPEFKAAMQGSVGRAVRRSTTLDKKEMYVAVPVEQAGQVVAAVRAAMPLATVNDALPELYWRIALGAALVALVAALAGFVVSSGISRQMREIQDGARRFAVGSFAQKLRVPRTREFAAVAESLNTMAGQLDEEIRTLTRERNEREAVLASMVEGVIAVDMDERVITINEAAAHLLGADRAAAVGRSIPEVVRNPEFQRVVADALAGGAPVERELTLYAGTTERTLQANGTLLRGEDDDRPVGAVVVLNDVTRLKRLEAVRRDFVANVSHELKTPVTSIKGFAETLMEGAAEDPATRDRFLRIIAGQSERLIAIISDLLALSTLEAGQAGSAPLEEADVCNLVHGAVEVCGVEAKAKNITLEVACPTPVLAPVNAPLLEQAIVNLVDNAVKYSPTGRAVSVKVESSANEVSILVQDQGPGIARQHIPRLFERFYRVDSARSRDLGGTGLGLAIVKHVAQVHGGRVSVTSEVGHGSTFGLHLPRG
jgi:two-component system phosphate regulon sensor histidine kinase PhoR